MKLGNQKFQNALQRVPQAVPPIWMMRQAGRYHHHYQALRKRYSFDDLCRKPELAAETTLGPIEDFDFDVAILFSDLLFPLDALGMGLRYDGDGPKLAWHLDERSAGQMRKPKEVAQELDFQGEAAQATRARLPRDKSLIGFVGGPWTLFVYAVEGSHKGTLHKSRQLLPLFARFCEYLEPLLEHTIARQLEGGAEIVMLFDTAAGEISPQTFGAHVVPSLERLARSFPGKLGYYSKATQAAHLRAPLFRSELFAGIGVDHRWDIRDAFSVMGRGFVQGNFDQGFLSLSPQEFAKELANYLEPIIALSPEARAGWVAGLGHGCTPDSNPENVRHFVKILREVLR